jgi:hypothetical protein
MSDLFDSRAVPLHEQVAAAEREVRMRQRVYPGWIAKGRMKSDAADREIAAMQAIVRTLREVLARSDS